MNYFRITAILLLTISFFSCKKEYDNPPIDSLPVGSIVTVADVKAMHKPGEVVRINSDLSLYATVTMDESTGNLYKEAYVQDATGGLYLRFTASSGVYTGDSVRVYLRNTLLQKYNGMMQLDSLDPDKNIIKQETQQYRKPELTTITQILSYDTFYQARLVKLENVEFMCNDIGKTYADAVNQQDQSRYLQDSLGIQIEVRTSGYAGFANSAIPSGKGTFVGVVNQYGSTMQLLVRSPNELSMTGTRSETCPFLVKDFEDQSITSGNWSTQNVVANVNFTTNGQGAQFGSYYGQITNWDGSNNTACETWLISPSIDLSQTISPILTFENAYNYAGNQLELYVATNYTGDVTTTTWTPLIATWSTGSWSWVNSGNISLSAYKQSGVRIAFKYTGASNSGSTWEIDDIKIKEN